MQGGHIVAECGGIAVPGANRATVLVPAGPDTAGEREYVGQIRTGVVERVAPRAGDLAEHRYLPAAHPDHVETDLGFQYEFSLDQFVGDPGLRVNRCKSGERDLADERKGDGAPLGDARLGSEIRILENGNADGIAFSECFA